MKKIERSTLLGAVRAGWIMLAAACIAGCAARQPAALGSLAERTADLAQAPAERCAELVERIQAWPDPTTRIEQATWQPAQPNRQGPPGSALPPHCEINASMRERTGVDDQVYAIRFRLRLPQAWNGRFFFEGGGGLNGVVGAAVGMIVPGQPTALERGYAVLAQDSGHDNVRNAVPARGGAAAFGFDPQARADYGGESLAPVTQAARALIRAYYGRDPQRSYFVGCSKGGQEGMYLAQRHPELFDGIVAAAPGFALPRAAVAEAWDTQAFARLLPREEGGGQPDLRGLARTFSDAQLTRVRQAILQACDAADGAQDGITGVWADCTWSQVQPHLQAQVCADSPDCLSETHVEVLGQIHAGAQDSAGNALYATWPFDGGIGSDGWRIWKIGSPGGEVPAINVAMGAPALAAIFTTPPVELGSDPAAALRFALDFDFDRDAPKIYATSGPFTRSAWDMIGARSPDLAAFRARGGKMIVPHGVSDPVFSVNDTVAWYREVDRLNAGEAASFVRVFAVPGMAHCAGGPATDQFDAFEALVAWVEQGSPPDRILATAGPNTPWPGRSRPLCPYPQVARYTGEGSLEEAASFRCE